MDVFLLYHHVARAVTEGLSARHRNADGDLVIDEQAGDVVFCWAAIRQLSKPRIVFGGRVLCRGSARSLTVS